MKYVFDLDGTLIDSTYRHGYLMKEILEEEGIQLEKDFQEKYMDYKRNGLSSKEVLNEIYNFDVSLTDRVVDKWVKQIESDDMLCHDILYNDSIGVLKKIRNHGMKVYYLSLRQRKTSAIEELKNLRIFDYADEIFVGKPSEGVEYKMSILNQLGGAEKTIMIGDTMIDAEAAIGAKVDFFILNRGFRSQNYFDARGINTFNSLEELCIE